jgi:CheY-like chemotaxis protein
MPKTIMVVEDEATVARLVESVLSRVGKYEVLTIFDSNPVAAALSAVNALSAIFTAQPDLVITDGLKMNCDRVLAEAQRQGIPVVLISGELDKYVELGGFAARLAKPFMPQGLLNTIEQVFKTT